MESRRAFLGRCGAGAAVWTALGNGGWSGLPADAAAFDPDHLGELAGFAIEHAKTAGASYADIRINRYRNQDISLRVQADRATGKPVEVPSVSDSGVVRLRAPRFGRRRLGVLGLERSDPRGHRPRGGRGRRDRPGQCLAPPRADPAGGDAVLPRYLPDQDRHRPVLRPDRAEARAAPRRGGRGAQGRGGVLGHGRVDRAAPRRPVISSRPRGASSSSTSTRSPRSSPRPPSRPAGRSSRAPTGRTRSAPATRPSSGPTSSATRAGSPRRPSRTSRRPRSRPASRTWC